MAENRFLTRDQDSRLQVEDKQYACEQKSKKTERKPTDLRIAFTEFHLKGIWTNTFKKMHIHRTCLQDNI